MSTAIKLLPMFALVIAAGVVFWLWADRRAWIKVSDEAHEIIMSMSGAGQRAQAAELRAEAALATITELKRQLADSEARARRRGRTRGTAAGGVTEIPGYGTIINSGTADSPAPSGT